MKINMNLLRTSVLLIALAIPHVAFAAGTPTINPVKSPFDGTKQTITGTADPGSRIQITGGPYQIPTVPVEANGTFRVVVPLTQDNNNIFFFSAYDMDGVSDQVEVRILESAAEAAAAAQSSGEDYMAPEAPTVDPVNEVVDAYHYTIEGEAEVGATVYVTGDDTGQVNVLPNGTFRIQVSLNQNETNLFYLEAHDDAGNISPKTPFEIREQGESAEETDVRVVIDETAGEGFQADIADSFSDLAGHPQEEYIESLRIQGVLQGYPDGTVKPDGYVNRAELLKMATLSFGFNVLSEASEAPFSDTPRLAWYTRFIQSAFMEELIDGYPDGTFKPEKTVNKAEALKIILELSRIPYNPNPGGVTLFTDVTSEHRDTWYYPYVYFMRDNRIINGYADGTLRPADLMTRGELAEIIVRLQNFQSENQ